MPKQRPIPPPVQTGSQLPLMALSWEQFQLLCRDVSMRVEGSGACSVFGKPGQKQLGADLKGESDDRLAVEIGQCKREEKFTASKVERASKEFLDNWEPYWKVRGVKKFRLFVARELDERKCQEQLETGKRRLALIER